MKTRHAADQLERQATEALKALLGQVSAVKLREMRREAPGHGRAVEILAHVDVFGHSHTLACEVKSNGTPSHLRTALRELHIFTAHFAEAATPVIIAPYLSPKAQALCKQSHAGFLDLEGNARLALGEVFIGKRSVLPHQSAARQNVPHQNLH